MEFDLVAWVSARLHALSSAKDVMAAAEALAVEASAEAGRRVTAAEIVTAFQSYAGTVARGTHLAYQVRSIQSALAMAGRTGARGLLGGGGGLLGGSGAAGGVIPALLLLLALGAGVYVASNLAGRLSADRAVAAGTLGNPNRTQNPPTALPIPTSNATSATQVPGAGKVWRLKPGFPKPNKEMAGYIAQGIIEAQPGILRVKDGNGAASWVFTELPEKLVVGETYTLKLDSASERLKDPKSNNNGYAAVLHIAGSRVHPGESHGTKYIKAVITPHDASVQNAATSGTVTFRFEPSDRSFGWMVRVNGCAGGYWYEYEPVP